MSVDKTEWMQRYTGFFDVPEWLAEEKFHFCDDDGNMLIRLQEIQCF